MYECHQALTDEADQEGVVNQVEGTQAWPTSAPGPDPDREGIPDGGEDANHDGTGQGAETDPLLADSHFDGIQDGTELGFTAGTSDTCTTSGQSGCSNAWLFVADAEPWTMTNPLSIDSDSDGIADGVEDLNHNGKYDAVWPWVETNATAQDTDADGLADGVERGVVTPLNDTDLTKFVWDKDPSTLTNATNNDTDTDGLFDGLEDRNH